jgi:hypothetical protein
LWSPLRDAFLSEAHIVADIGCHREGEQVYSTPGDADGIAHEAGARELTAACAGSVPTRRNLNFLCRKH